MNRDIGAKFKPQQDTGIQTVVFTGKQALVSALCYQSGHCSIVLN